MLWREVGVPDRHRDCLVPCELLSSPQIDSGHHQTADKRVAQSMPCEVWNLCVVNNSIEPSSRVVEIASMLRLEDSPVVRPSRIEFLKCLDAALVHRDLPAAPVLRLVEQDALAPERNLAPFEAVLFDLTHPRVQGDIKLLHMTGAADVDGLPDSCLLVSRQETQSGVLLRALLDEPSRIA